MRDNTRRFRFSTLTSRFNQLRELWGRRMREREEGPLDFRRRQAAMSAPADPPPGAPKPERVRPTVTSEPGDAYLPLTRSSNGAHLNPFSAQIEQATPTP